MSERLRLLSVQYPEFRRCLMGRYISRLGKCQIYRFLPLSGKGFSLRMERNKRFTRAQLLCQTPSHSGACMGKTQKHQRTVRRHNHHDDRESVTIAVETRHCPISTHLPYHLQNHEKESGMIRSPYRDIRHHPRYPHCCLSF